MEEGIGFIRLITAWPGGGFCWCKVDWNAGSLLGAVWLCSSPSSLLSLFLLFFPCQRSGVRSLGWSHVTILTPKSYLLKAIFFLHYVPVIWPDSLAARCSLASFGTQDYITVQHPLWITDTSRQHTVLYHQSLQMGPRWTDLGSVTLRLQNKVVGKSRRL